MRVESKIIKNNILENFPNSKITIKYIQAKDYTISSDKIQIKTNISYKILSTYLRQNIKGAMIYQKGSFISKNGDFGSIIFGKESSIEFIEIETII